jgi:predicted nucleotidyltransferase
MKHVGIICEYNPFHGGHAHLLREVREAQTVICLMSGNFTQRGEAAILPPRARAAMAMAAGADLVLELPFPYAAGSARYFATAGVRALSALCADTLAFGSESADLDALLAAAKRTTEQDFDQKVANGMKNRGSAALYFDALGDDRVPPNDILATEYVRAVLLCKEQMELHPVLRVGAGYHDLDEQSVYPSATALRAKLREGADVTALLPPEVRETWQSEVSRWGIAETERLGTSMLARLRAMDGGDMGEKAEIADCGGGLLERLIRAADEATDYAGLCRAAATKKYTDGRIRRALLYLMAGVTREDLLAPPAYLRLLAANGKGREFLSETRKTRTVPVITKPCDIAALGDSAARARRLASIADGLYALCMPQALTPSVLATEPPLML